MFPKDTEKTFISFAMGLGDKEEAPITNESFLSSFLEYGCWLRSVAARPHYQTLERKDAQPIERLAALTAFYQLTGLAIEDAISNFIAWSLWAADKEQSLPDIFGRLSLRFSIPDSSKKNASLDRIKEKFVGSKKRVEIDAREYLRLLLAEPKQTLPNLLGIEWKRNASVKLVPKEHKDFWNDLPNFIHGVISPLAQPKGALLSACYNKVKHGPQLVLGNVTEAITARGLEGLFESPPNPTKREVSIRLLMDGARTQETEQEVNDGVRISPFLIDDSANIKRLYYRQLVHNAGALFNLGTWLFNSTYKDRKRPLQFPNTFVEDAAREHLVNIGTLKV